MKTEYVVEIYRKENDKFVQQLDVFETYNEAKAFMNTTYIGDDCYIRAIVIYYDDEGNEIGYEGM